MAQRGVLYQKQVESGGGSKDPVSIDEGIERVKQMASMGVDRKYKGAKKRKTKDQTVEICMHLGIDARQADQMLRGAISLPRGIGKDRKVIAFCDDNMIEEAKAAGAIEAGSDELVKKIEGGWMDFDVAIAHPSMMGRVGKLGRVLGPQGKMPSPKAGTVTPELVQAVKDFAAGRIEFRNDAGGNIHMPVGKASFSSEALKENIEAIIAHITKLKPAAAKGTYVKRISLSGSQTPSVTLTP